MRSFLWVLAVLGAISCSKKATLNSRPGDASEIIPGYVIDLHKAYPRCRSEALGMERFRIECRAYTRDIQDKEIEVTGFPDEIRFLWSDPSGNSIQVTQCTAAENTLSRTCEVTAEQASRAEVNLRLERSSTQEIVDKKTYVELTLSGKEDRGYFGVSVASAGDVNGDGKPDLLVGEYLADAGGTDRGKAHVFDGATGNPLHTLSGDEDGARFGYAVARLGDVNGDGLSEFMVGAYRAPAGGYLRGKIVVFNGRSGRPLYSLTGTEDNAYFGAALAAVDDINGDGKPDILVSAEKADVGGTDRGTVFLFSGADGRPLYHVSGLENGARLGHAVSGVGDVDADGRGDFIIGAYGADLPGVRDAGKVFVYSGREGSLLHTLAGLESTGFFGSAVATLGDLDGDSTPDFAIGEYGAEAGGSNRGRVHFYSGKNGSRIQTLTSTENEAYFGYSLAGVGDLDGDGKGDVLVGAYLADEGGIDRGGAYVYSGATGQRLFTFQGRSNSGRLGFAVASAGDLNGDGKNDMLLSEYCADENGVNNSGRVYVRSGADGSAILVTQ